ncbi:MAG: hypothetical protein KDI09_16755 [Halioglobus sp.]|nr:hypothetical protein [Halioglobus sp.]
MNRFTAGVVALILCSGVTAREQVAQFTGAGSSTTAEFEVTAPWILDWRVNSDFQGSMAIEISLVDGDSGFHKGLILQTKRPNNGVRLFRESGRYRFRISSTLALWDLKVEELSQEEAEQYKPRGK